MRSRRAAASAAASSSASRAICARSTGSRIEQLGLAAGEREQCLDQLLAARELAPQHERRRLHVRGRSVRVGSQHLDLGAHRCQWRAQLVRGVSDEASLRAEHCVQPREHSIEGIRQLAQLVARSLQADPLVEVPACDALATEVIRRTERSRRPASSQPSATATSTMPARTARYCVTS